jgi:hypothetical protein
MSPSSFPGILVAPLVMGLAVGLILAFRRLNPVLVFFSMWLVFLSLAPRSSPQAPPMPIPLLASGGGILILLVASFLFVGVAFWSFARRSG